MRDELPQFSICDPLKYVESLHYHILREYDLKYGASCALQSVLSLTDFSLTA